jgi:hypothetical protein
VVLQSPHCFQGHESGFDKKFDFELLAEARYPSSPSGWVDSL